MMKNAFFEVSPTQISQLESLNLVQLLDRLLHAEARNTGIALSSISLPLQITVPDGGEDARIEWQGGIDHTDYLPRRFVSFQSKATKVSAASLKKEVWKPKTRKEGAPPLLNDVLRSVIAAHGAYIVFTSDEMNPQKIDACRQGIAGGIVEAGGQLDDIVINVYDANKISAWVNRHPGVASWLGEQFDGASRLGFASIVSWGKNPEISSINFVQEDDPRFAITDKIIPRDERKDAGRNAITFSQARELVQGHLAEPQQILRIAGASGLGKTRFAHALFATGLDTRSRLDAEAVIYCDYSIVGKQVFPALLSILEDGANAILVVDECSDRTHQALAKLVSRQDTRVRLITIGVETNLMPSERQKIVSVQPASKTLIGQIISSISPKLSTADADFLVGLADGFPGMAVLAAEAYNTRRTHPISSVSDVIDRVLWGQSAANDEASRALAAASLFDVLRVGGDAPTDIDAIAEALAEMTAARMREHLDRFKARGVIIERGRFLQVKPLPLARHMAEQRLRHLGVSAVSKFLGSADQSLEMRFFDRLRWLDDCPEAQSIAKDLLKENSIGNLPSLNSEAGSRIFDRLVHVVPDEAMKTLDRVLGQLSTTELHNIEAGRRYLVWALEKLVFRAQTFEHAARLLLRLAIAENEDRIGNNATGEFEKLYQLYLSGTEAPPKSRLALLDEALELPDARAQEICVNALGKMLDTGHFFRSGGAESLGSRQPLKDWQPQTHQEVWDFYSAALNRLTEIALTNHPLAQRAKNLIGHHLRGLINAIPFSQIEPTIARISGQFSYWPEAIRSLNHWLYFDRRGAPADLAVAVRLVYDSLIPVDPVARAVFFASGWDSDVYDPDQDYDKDNRDVTERHYATRTAAALADNIALDDALVSRCIGAMTGKQMHSGFAFGKRLASAVRDPEAFFKQILTQVRHRRTIDQLQFVRGALAGIDDRDPALARKFLRLALKERFLKEHAPNLITAFKTSENDLSLVVSLLQSGDVTPDWCRSLSYGKGLDHLSPEHLLPLFEELHRHGAEGLWTALEIISMRLHGRADLPAALASELKTILTAGELFKRTERHSGDGFRFENEFKRLDRHALVDEIFAINLSRQIFGLACLGNADILFNLRKYTNKILPRLIEINADGVFNELCAVFERLRSNELFWLEQLLEPEGDDRFGAGVLSLIPEETINAWVREEPNNRAAFVAEWLPMAIVEPESMRRWHPRIEAFVHEFSQAEGVLATLSRRLMPSSWWGSVVPFIEPWRPMLEQWRYHHHAEVRDWAMTQIDSLEQWIAREASRDGEHELGIY